MMMKMPPTATPTKKVFRFKLQDEMMILITQFAKTHQHDDRHTYKEHWNNWLQEQNETIEREVNRLNQLGYTGDVLDKMFKAGRYYFREKHVIKAAAAAEASSSVSAEAEPKKRREYIVMHQEIIQLMDNHLKSNVKQYNFKPAAAYLHFCETNIAPLRKEIFRLKRENPTISDTGLVAKFKKTYKNRYFMLKL